MSKGMWAASVLIVALLVTLFAADPLGLFTDPEAGSRDEGSNEAALDLDPGLQGRGDGKTATARLTSFEGEPVGSVDLGLGSGILEGRVLGAGTPLHLARVRAALPPPANQTAVRTREDGTYQIRGLPMGQHDVRVTHPEFVGETVVAPLLAQPGASAPAPAADTPTAPASTPGVTRGTTDETPDQPTTPPNETEQPDVPADAPPARMQTVQATVPDVDLMRRRDSTNAVVVQVRDAAGRPLPGCKILATTIQWDLHLAMGPAQAGIKGHRAKSGTTDETGLCRLTGLEPDRYDIAITKQGFVTEAVERVQVSENRSRKINVRLVEGQSIRGRVSTADGRGIEGAIVMGFHMPSFHSSLTARTDASGDFVLSGLRKGQYTLMGFHAEYGQVQAQAQSPGAGLNMKLGGTGTINLKVKWASGEPVTEATVRPFAAQIGFGYVYSQVEKLDDPKGETSLVLPNGNYLVRVQTPDGALSKDVKADVTVGETKTIEITMPETGVVRGVVVNAQGEHVPGAQIYIRRGGFPPHKSREQYARSNEDGEFEVTGLNLEAVKLRVEHAEYADTEISTNAQPPKTASELTVRMSRGAVVTGHVRDTEGGPIANRQVTLFQNWFEPVVTYTDGDGLYVFRAVKEGTWMVKEGPFENQAPGETKTGVVVPAEGTVVSDFQLNTSSGTVTGTVQMGGKPIAGATVTIFSDATGASMISATTNDDGRFEAPGVSIAEFRVYINTTDNLTASERGTFAEGTKTTDITIELGRSGMKGRIVRTEGGPLSGAWVSVETVETGDGFDRTKGWKTSQTDGTFEFGGLSAGKYQIRVSHPEYAQMLTDPIDLGKEGVLNLGDLKLAAGAVLSGRVVDDAGSPIEDATISLTDSAGRPVFLFSFSTTGSDGRYSVQGLEIGQYTVKIEAKGYSPYSAPMKLEAGGAVINGTLTRGGGLELTVTDDAGYPIKGATVTLYDAGGTRIEKTLSLVNLFDGGANRTDETGVARLTDLAAAAYKAVVSHDGYQAEGASIGIAIRPGETTKASVSLVKK